MNHVLNWIYPTTCGMCGKINSNGLCKKCEISLRKEWKFTIDKDKKKEDSYIVEHAYFSNYTGSIRKKIIEYKFQNQSYLYQFFSYMILKEKKICVLLEKYDIILPVPIHKKRKRKRGFNQSELIAREIANQTDHLDLETNSLMKIQDNMPQRLLGRSERRKNPIGAYQVRNIEKVKGKNILLFDDVYTTGSTTKECARVLIETGQAKSVGVLTIAKD